MHSVDRLARNVEHMLRLVRELLRLPGDDEIVDQSLGGDQGGQFLDAIALLLPDIQRREGKLVDRDADDASLVRLDVSMISIYFSCLK